MKRCDDVRRRDFVRIGSLAGFAWWLNVVPRLACGDEIVPPHSRNATEGAASGPENRNATEGVPYKSKANRCILIWLDGGPSHLETFDLKPDAPAEVRGPFRPIATSVPGISICELLPKLANRLESLAIVRSVTSPLGEHNLGTQYMLTGYQPTPALEYPTLGSVVAHLDQADAALPKFMAVPTFRVGGQQFAAAGYLPRSAAPFEVGADPSQQDFRVRDLNYYPGLDSDRIDRRREYLARLDRMSRQLDATGSPGPEEAFAAAYRLVNAPKAKAAFNLKQEPAAVRARYGPRTIGQSALLARRLVEAGVPFVAVNYPGWDTHQNLYTSLKEGYTGAQVPVGLIPSLDHALSALHDDLWERRLLDETLIVVMGEFGRTPKLNTQGGRDHWPRVFSVLLAGGGIRGGQTIGSSDATGESPKDRPVTPADLATTIYTLLGIDPRRELNTSDGRPVRIAQGQFIPELV
jgi:hypothetical protein